jgi:transcriptional regulator with XRE-family HTH domain
MSQRDLAAASGVGAATIARLERKLHMARPLTVRRLAAALGIRPEDLMAEPAFEASMKENP